MEVIECRFCLLDLFKGDNSSRMQERVTIDHHSYARQTDNHTKYHYAIEEYESDVDYVSP